MAARPQLQAQLAAVQRDRRDVELARLAYYPDFAFSVSWMGMASEGALAPTFGRSARRGDRRDGQCADLPAAARRGRARGGGQDRCQRPQVRLARDQTTEEVKDLLVQATSQGDLIDLFRGDILPKSDQTLRASMNAYEVGKTDFLQLIDNWRQLLRFQLAYQRLESQQQQTIASLERVVGGQLPLEVEPTTGSHSPDVEEVPPLPPGPPVKMPAP